MKNEKGGKKSIYCAHGKEKGEKRNIEWIYSLFLIFLQRGKRGKKGKVLLIEFGWSMRKGGRGGVGIYFTLHLEVGEGRREEG